MTPVYLHYDQKALDDAYDQAVYAPNRDQLVARGAKNSALARSRLGEPQRLVYGASAFEKLDVYRARTSGAPINVHIHGGAWRRRNASDYAYPAEMFVAAGAHFVALDFISVDDEGGSLTAMADQVRRAVAWVHQNSSRFGGDSTRLYVSGSSSGAHLGGVVASTDWKKDFGLPADAVKGYALCSGMYDLRGPRLSKRSSYIKFTDEMEEALSPMRHLDRIGAPIVLIYGSLETPEFQRQSRDFAEALRKAAKQVELVHAEGYNHFEVTESLANPFGPFGRAALAQMGLKLGS